MDKVLVAVSFAAVCAGSGCVERAAARGDQPAVERVLAVETVQLAHVDVALPIESSGVLGADREADLAFKVSGVVERVLVDEGARVHKGQLLATIDATEFKAAAGQASESLQKSERDLTRAQTLHETRSLALADFQNAQTSLALARSVNEAAEFNLKHTALVAPAAGVLDRRLVQSGEIVGAGQPIFRMSTSQGGCVVRVGLVDRERLAVKLGDTAEVRLDAQPERVFRGVVSELATTASPGTGSFEVEVRVDDRALLDLPSGLTAKVKLTRTLPHALRVPLSALVDGRGRQAAVYLVADARARRQPVDVLEFTGDFAILRDGLADGAALVTLGAADLRDGSPVRVVAREQ